MTSAQPRILLVDDHAFVREGIRLVLRDFSSSPKIVEAGSLAQAREKLSAASFDLVLLDYRLPDSHGVSGLAETIAARRGARRSW